MLVADGSFQQGLPYALHDAANAWPVTRSGLMTTPESLTKQYRTTSTTPVSGSTGGTR